MRNPLAAVLCLWLLGCELAIAADGPDRPVATAKPSPISAAPSGASSFAPRPRSKNHAYGTPIQPPIFHRVKPTHRKTPTKAPAGQ
jgi:hypothetical protein